MRPSGRTRAASGGPSSPLTPARQLAALRRALRGLAGRAAPKRRTAFYGVRAQLGDELTDLLERRLAECPDRRVADMYRAAADRLSVASTGESGGSAFYSPREDGVHIDLAGCLAGDATARPGQVVFHEFGHMADSLGARAKGAPDAGCYASVGYRGGAIPRALKEDWDAVKLGMDVERYGRSLKEKAAGGDVRGVRSEIRGAGERYVELTRRQRGGDITADEMVDAYMADIRAGKTPIPNDWRMLDGITDIEAAEALSERFQDVPLITKANASDIVEALSGKAHPFGAGHINEENPNYWERDETDGAGHRASAACTEFFAEFCDATMANEMAAEFTRELFPTAWGLCGELAEEIAGAL